MSFATSNSTIMGAIDSENNNSDLSRHASMLLMVVVMFTATSAIADESQPESGAVLKLPTTAGHVVADVVGSEPPRLAPLEDATLSKAKSELPNNGSVVPSAPRFEARPAWKLRGWLTAEEFIAGREEAGLATDAWDLNSWRLDAAMIRTF